MAHKLHTVANAKDRHAERQNFRVEILRAFAVNAVRPAGQNNADEVDFSDFFRADAARFHKRIHFCVPDTTGNQFLILSPEIEDENRLIIQFKHLVNFNKCKYIIFLIFPQVLRGCFESDVKKRRKFLRQ